MKWTTSYPRNKDRVLLIPIQFVKVLHNIQLQLPVKGLVGWKVFSGFWEIHFTEKYVQGNLKVNEGKIAFLMDGNQCVVAAMVENEFVAAWISSRLFRWRLRYNVFWTETVEAKKDYPAFSTKILNKKIVRIGKLSWVTMESKPGGEKQLVTLARMMLYPQPVAILDEPTANLDAATVEIILEQILKCRKERLWLWLRTKNKFDAHLPLHSVSSCWTGKQIINIDNWQLTDDEGEDVIQCCGQSLSWRNIDKTDLLHFIPFHSSIPSGISKPHFFGFLFISVHSSLWWNRSLFHCPRAARASISSGYFIQLLPFAAYLICIGRLFFFLAVFSQASVV